MNTTERKLGAPQINAENQRYFDATAKGELLIGKCDVCGEHHFYPRTLCPHCFSDQVQWVPAKGSGVIYTFSTLQRGVPVPYTIAYVALEEGVTMMTNLVDCEPAKLAIGQPVTLAFRESEDGSKLPVFKPL